MLAQHTTCRVILAREEKTGVPGGVVLRVRLGNN